MRLLSKAKHSKTLKQVLFYLIVAFLAVYVFSIPSFGESKTFTRYIVYASLSALGLTAAIYCFLYEKRIICLLFFGKNINRQCR